MMKTSSMIHWVIAGTIVLCGATASAGEITPDERREIRQERRELKQDRRELKQDRRQLKADRRQLRQQRRELRRKVRDAVSD